jgi:transcription elongation factor GreA
MPWALFFHTGSSLQDLIDLLGLWQYKTYQVYRVYSSRSETQSMSNQETFLTEEGHQKLEEELHYLKNVRRPEVAEAIHDAKMDGDVTENAGYEEAKRQQAFLEGRIMTLEAMLKSVVIIEQNGPSDTVNLGSRVTVVEEGFEPETYTIVGSVEANPGDGRISNESPLGSALLGRKVGDKVTFETPAGPAEMELLKIE